MEETVTRRETLVHVFAQIEPEIDIGTYCAAQTRKSLATKIHEESASLNY